MLGLSMMLGSGLPVYRVEINSNRNHWDMIYDAPQTANLGYPITLYLTIGPGVTVETTAIGYDAILFNTLQPGSVVYLTNYGNIRGWSTYDDISLTTAVRLTDSGVTLNINNGSGYIVAGTLVDPGGYGYAVRYPASSTLNWISGSSRISGTVYQG